MHPNVVQEAVKYDRQIDLPMWMSSLSLEDNAVSFYEQKELECEMLEKQTGQAYDGGTLLKKRGPKISSYGLERGVRK
jgi:hypothetical protein